jgi:hypothetical protein
LAAAGLAAAGLAGAAGALATGLGAWGAAGLAAGAVGAFFTERMAFCGGAAGEGALAAWEPLPPLLIRLRMRAASSSLMELLWLFAAIASFSAASSTSLFSRPKSLDSS